MLRKGTIERERLFSLYASNLSIYHPNVTDKFLCPICLTLFTRDALINNPPELSLAHIIPKSLKGHLYTLVCRRCDNWVGSEYDSHLAREKHFRDWEQGETGISGHLRYDESSNKEVAVECYLKGSTIEFRDIPQKSPPSSWEQFLKAAASDWSNFKFTFTVSAYNPSKLNISILYSAFLMMFYQLGYEYVLSPNAHRIRQFIQGSGFPGNMHKAILVLSKDSQNLPHISPSVSILVEPQNVRSFIVVLPPSRKEDGARCVLFPGFGKDGENAYTNTLNSVKPFENFGATLIPDYLRKYRKDAKYKWFANWLWRNVV